MVQAWTQHNSKLTLFHHGSLKIPYTHNRTRSSQRNNDNRRVNVEVDVGGLSIIYATNMHLYICIYAIEFMSIKHLLDDIEYPPKRRRSGDETKRKQISEFGSVRRAVLSVWCVVICILVNSHWTRKICKKSQTEQAQQSVLDTSCSSTEIICISFVEQPNNFVHINWNGRLEFIGHPIRWLNDYYINSSNVRNRDAHTWDYELHTCALFMYFYIFFYFFSSFLNTLEKIEAQITIREKAKKRWKEFRLHK